MANTPVYGWPYQGLSDPPNGAGLGESLALAAEATVQAQVAALQTLIDFLRNKPAAQVRQSVAQSLTTGVYAGLTFTVETVDSDPAGTGGHSTSVNTSRYTAVYAGTYRVGGVFAVSDAAGGYRSCRWAVNGTPLDASASLVLPLGGGVSLHLPAPSILVPLGVGDYIELQGQQNSGGAVNTAVAAELASSMSIDWVRL